MRKFLLSLMAIFGLAFSMKAATDAPAYISIAWGPNFLSFPTPKEGDMKIYPSTSNPDIYEGVVEMKKGASFAFFTDEGIPYTGTPDASDGEYIFITFGESNVFPKPDDDEDYVNSQLDQNNEVMMCINGFPPTVPSNLKTTNLKLSINWAEQTFSLSLPDDYTLEAPQALYVWGTLGGFTSSARYNVMATMAQTDTDSHIYECTMEIPDCGPFESDGEFSPSDGAPDYGFYYFISDDNTSISKGTVYMVPLANRLISLPEVGDVFTSSLLTNKTGSNMICLTPGKVRMTYNFDTNTYTVTKLENPAPVPENYSVTLSFTGVEDAFKYVKVTDIITLERLEINSDNYNFEFEETATLDIVMQEEYIEKGYSYSITCDHEASSDTYELLDHENKYQLKLYPGAEGFTFIVNVTEQITDAVDGIFMEENPVYYDLSGRKVTNPDKGIYIKVQNGNNVKIKKN